MFAVVFRGRRCAYIAFYDANAKAEQSKAKERNQHVYIAIDNVKTLAKRDGVRTASVYG